MLLREAGNAIRTTSTVMLLTKRRTFNHAAGTISNPDGARKPNGCKGYTGDHTKAPEVRAAVASVRQSPAMVLARAVREVSRPQPGEPPGFAGCCFAAGHDTGTRRRLKQVKRERAGLVRDILSCGT